MLGRIGVGKGLNVKGKSSKKNRLSGFVPFLQISKNEHKAALDPPPMESRIVIYYRNPEARTKARGALDGTLKQMGRGL